MSIYIHLFHGREDPNWQDPDGNYGFTGPLLGPFTNVHMEYAMPPRISPPNVHLGKFEDMLFYDGKFYGGWTAVGEFYALDGDYCPGAQRVTPGMDEDEFKLKSLVPDPMPDPWRPAMNTRLSYMYRDGGNYKFYADCVVAGRVTWEELKAYVDNDFCFIPFNAGLPCGQAGAQKYASFPDDTDHVYNEMYEDGSSVEATKATPTVLMTAKQLLAKFKEQHEKSWPEGEAMEHFGIL